MSTSFPETQNREWGFFGTISRHGRHFADEVSDDLSRENILRRAANLKDLDSGILFPGILINTSPTHLRPIRQMQLTRWTGKFWQVFGDLIEAA